jgi:hypothetical protein
MLFESQQALDDYCKGQHHFVEEQMPISSRFEGGGITTSIACANDFYTDDH